MAYISRLFLFSVFFTVFQLNSAEMVDAHLGKKYKLATSENFDEFMKALGESTSERFFFFLRRVSEVSRVKFSRTGTRTPFVVGCFFSC
jgi:hypothetical protein